MNAPPFPTNPAPGDTYCGWTWNGTQWICTQGQQIVVQTFTQSGTYQPSPGLLSLVVECIGGGGNGGAAGGDVGNVAGGGGGGSGGYSRKALSAALVRGGVIVTVGVGGAAAPLPPPANDYAAGGTATGFGALCFANGGGGGGGNASAANIWGWPGLGAPVGVGDVALPGNPGAIGTSQTEPTGSVTNAVGGAGGAIWGGGGTPTLMGVGGASAGNPGTGPGAGGSGAAQNEFLATLGGGLGANGICVVTEYCFADMGWTGGGCAPPSNCASTGMARVAIAGGPTQGQWGYDDGN